MGRGDDFILPTFSQLFNYVNLFPGLYGQEIPTETSGYCADCFQLSAVRFLLLKKCQVYFYVKFISNPKFSFSNVNI